MAALTASNDEIARMGADINGLVRLLRRGEMPSAVQMEATLTALSTDLRAHLRCTSRLVADLAPFVAIGRAGAVQTANSRGAVR